MDPGVQFRRGDGADDMADDTTVSGDEEGVGLAVETVEAGSDPEIGIVGHRIADAGAMDEGDGVRRLIGHVDADELDAGALARSASAVLARRGVSFWQGVHHEAKKLSTTGWWTLAPRASRSTGTPPVSDGRVKPGARLPIGTMAPGSDEDPEPVELDRVPKPKKRKMARPMAMTVPMARARPRRGGGRWAAGGAEPRSGPGAVRRCGTGLPGVR